LSTEIPESNVTLDPEQEKRWRFVALAHLFAQRAAQRPLLLVVEDIHWSDDNSLELLSLLARQCASHPMLLVVTYRDEERDSPLLPWLAQLDRARLGQEIVLSRLTRDDVATMLGAMFAQVHPIRADFLDAIFALTDGNPFFIEEVVRGLVAAGDIFQHDGMWDRRPVTELHIPRSVHDAVRREIARASEPARHILRLAAVVGRRFDFSLLLALTDHTEAEVVQALKELIAAQLVVEESSERFAFRHALVREAIYAGLLTRERAALHRAIGECIERLAAQSTDQRLPDLAYHYAEAGVWESSYIYARRAGEQAIQLDAPRAAVAHFASVFEALRRLDRSPEPAFLLMCGTAYETLGEFEHARDDFAAALDQARAHGDQRVEWQALLALGLHWSSSDYQRAGQFLREALTLARDLDDPALVAHSLNRLGNWHMNAEAPREAEHYHHEALAVFRRLDDRRGVAETLDLLGMATASAGGAQQSYTYFEEAIGAFRTLNDRQGLVTPLVMQCIGHGSYLLNDGFVASVPLDIEQVTRQGEEALRLAQECGWRAGEAFVMFELSMIFGMRGAYARALELGRRALAVAEEIQHRQWIIGSTVAMGRLHLDLLALPQAQDYLERALEMAHALSSSNWVQIVGAMLAATYVQQNDLARADALLTATFEVGAPPQALGQRMGCVARCELALAQGHSAQALNDIDLLLLPAAEQSPTTSIAPRHWQMRGEAQAALGEWAAAEESLVNALQAARTCGFHPLIWRIHRSLALLYQKMRQREAARAELAAAHATIEKITSDLPDDQLRETFLSDIQKLVPTPRQGAQQRHVGGLTTRERDVAALLTGGMSNREVAEALVVSERTVEYHVRNVLSKLGLSSRGQIAVWAIQHDLVSQRGSQRRSAEDEQ
jgi:DNA-binding NarL/FixJ family response regulator